MTTTITKRITAAASGGQTKRVNTSSLGASYRTWGESWGDTWLETWRVALAISLIGITQRVTATASGGQTKRVTGV